MKTFLLSLIAAAVVVIAGVLVYDRVAGEPERTDAWESAWDEAESRARLYCSLGGVVPGMTGLHDPAYKNCVQDEAERDMETWESQNPDKVWK